MSCYHSFHGQIFLPFLLGSCISPRFSFERVLNTLDAQEKYFMWIIHSSSLGDAGRIFRLVLPQKQYRLRQASANLCICESHPRISSVFNLGRRSITPPLWRRTITPLQKEPLHTQHFSLVHISPWIKTPTTGRTAVTPPGRTALRGAFRRPECRNPARPLRRPANPPGALAGPAGSAIVILLLYV